MTSSPGFELLPSILIPCLTLLSMAGMGALVLRFTLVRCGALSRVEFSVAAFVLGMMVYSLVLFFVGVAGVFGCVWVIFMRIGGMLGLAFVLYAYRSQLVVRWAADPAWLLLTLLAILCGLLTLGAYLSPLVHPDARQYHLGLPWLLSISGRLSGNETLLHNGIYLGYDILYSSVSDLTQLADVPAMMDGLKLFNAVASAVFPVSTLLLCRAFGGSKAVSALAAIAVFSLGPIVYWGFLKNDIVAAGVGLTALVALVRAYDQTNERMLFIATALAAYAVSVKITNAFPLLFSFAFVYFSQRLSPKARVIGAAIGLALLLPWIVYAYVVSGNPFTPVAIRFPEEIRQAAALRNANGIEPSAFNLVTKFVPITLGKYPISGNQSLGILSLVVMAVSLVILAIDMVKRRVGLPGIVVASALLWFSIFYASSYDNRFLSRYMLICFGILFAFVCSKMETYSWRLPRRMRVAFFLSGIVLVSAFVVKNPGVAASYERLAGFEGSEQTKREKAAVRGEYLTPYRAIERLRKPGEAVAINDHMVLFLKPPLFNLHGIHAVSLNLYAKDADYVRRYLSERSVRLLLFRKGISGGTPAVDEYMAECAQKVQTFGNSLSLYVVRQNCR